MLSIKSKNAIFKIVNVLYVKVQFVQSVRYLNEGRSQENQQINQHRSHYSSRKLSASQARLCLMLCFACFSAYLRSFYSFVDIKSCIIITINRFLCSISREKSVDSLLSKLSAVKASVTSSASAIMAAAANAEVPQASSHQGYTMSLHGFKSFTRHSHGSSVVLSEGVSSPLPKFRGQQCSDH